MSKTCENCQFFQKHSTQMFLHDRPKVDLLCHRYPQPVKVSPDHWCGEHTEAPTKPAPKKAPAKAPARRKATTSTKKTQTSKE